MLTRCPHCGATFRVTEAHLNAAHGKVRCGSCMAIFNATEHLLKTPEPSPVAYRETQDRAQDRAERREPVFMDDPNERTSERASRPMVPVDTDTKINVERSPHPREADGTYDLIDDNSPLPDEDAEGDLSDEDLVAELEAALKKTGQADFEQRLNARSKVAFEKQEFEREKEAWEIENREIDDSLESILQDDELNQTLDEISLETEMDRALNDRELAEVEAELDAILAEADPGGLDDDYAKSSTSISSDSLYADDDEELLFQDNPEEDRVEGRYHTGKLVADEELSDIFKELDTKKHEASQFSKEKELEEDEEQLSDESWAEEMLEELQGTAKPKPAPADPVPASTSDPVVVEEPLPAPEPIRAAPIAAYDRLKLEPISVEEEESSEGSALRVIGWTLVNLALLVALAAQLAWFHYDKLARNDSLRPLYSVACQWLGCSVPALLDINQIKSSNLVVRSHPSVSKALVIDVMVTNQAHFEQPFPNISFQFSDLNGNVVAQRIFEPKDYLSGDALDSTVMPPETPVHISLEILDPGNEAVNYTMSFLHRENSST